MFKKKKEAAIEEQKTADDWCGEGMAAYHEKDFETATTCFNEALALNQQCVRALNGHGVISFDQTDFDKALAIFIESLSIQPGKNVLALSSCLQIVADLFEQGFFKQSKEVFDQIYEIVPKNQDILNFWETMANRFSNPDKTQKQNLFYRNANLFSQQTLKIVGTNATRNNLPNIEAQIPQKDRLDKTDKKNRCVPTTRPHTNSVPEQSTDALSSSSEEAPFKQSALVQKPATSVLLSAGGSTRRPASSRQTNNSSKFWTKTKINSKQTQRDPPEPDDAASDDDKESQAYGLKK